MVVHNAGRCSSPAQHVTESPLSTHGEDGGVATQSALRALLLLSGAVSPNDLALKRTSDADIAVTTDILTLLGTSKPSTHAA